MSLHCYEIPAAFREALYRAIDPETGELSESGIAEIRAMTQAAEHSVADLAAAIREIELEASAILSITSAQEQRAQRLGKIASRWRALVLDVMETAGRERVKDPRISVALRNNPPSVEIVAADEVPPAFWRIIPESRSPDKTAIKSAVKNGQVVPGVALVTTRRVEIR